MHESECNLKDRLSEINISIVIDPSPRSPLVHQHKKVIRKWKLQKISQSIRWGLAAYYEYIYINATEAYLALEFFPTRCPLARSRSQHPVRIWPFQRRRAYHPAMALMLCRERLENHQIPHGRVRSFICSAQQRLPYFQQQQTRNRFQTYIDYHSYLHLRWPYWESQHCNDRANMDGKLSMLFWQLEPF